MENDFDGTNLLLLTHKLTLDVQQMDFTYSRLPNNRPPSIVNLLKIFHPGHCYSPIINFEKIFACVGTKDGKMYLSITTALLNITKGSNPPIIPTPPPPIINSNQSFNPPPPLMTPPPPPPHYSGVESRHMHSKQRLNYHKTHVFQCF